MPTSTTAATLGTYFEFDEDYFGELETQSTGSAIASPLSGALTGNVRIARDFYYQWFTVIENATSSRACHELVYRALAAIDYSNLHAGFEKLFSEQFISIAGSTDQAATLAETARIIRGIPLKLRAEQISSSFEWAGVHLFAFENFDDLGITAVAESPGVIPTEDPSESYRTIKTGSLEPDREEKKFYRPCYRIGASIEWVNAGLSSFYFEERDHSSSVRIPAVRVKKESRLEYWSGWHDSRNSNPKDACLNLRDRTVHIGNAPPSTKSGKQFLNSVHESTQWSGRIGKHVIYEIGSLLFPDHLTGADADLQRKTPIPHLLWTSSGGHGYGRAQKVAPGRYLWEYKGSLEDTAIEKLAEVLGLDPKRRISVKDTTPMVNGRSYEYTQVKDTPNFTYEAITLKSRTEQDDVCGTYVLTNTPRPGIFQNLAAFAIGNSGNSLTDSEILQIFSINYYRKIRIEPDGSPVRNGKVIRDESTGLSLPITFRNQQNLQTIKSQAGPTLKNKGTDLGHPRGVRINAGSVMRHIAPLVADRSIDNKIAHNALSANNLASWTLARNNGDVRGEWQHLKQTTATELPRQEWCHLKGHGDGGDERLGNFVSGSYDCNTEQLAIESGQRLSTYYATGVYELRTTAYLFNNETQLLSRSYLTADATYEALMAAFREVKASKKGTRTDTGFTMPVAAFIRYKIIKEGKTSGGPRYQKIFDHIFEAQSEFFDVNQFRILSKTVEYALKGAALLAEETGIELPQSSGELSDPPTKRLKLETTPGT